ncbi:piggyBac transposable element-derived protein 4-like [Aricia agestis]|uniref:piggyBac transposable element-derived protein 4-like n=1 Tax=Aricia agestis TaxID=91739 RepID=UPI001C208685|nr:piggyBac transposable element-derived protein 4-like [Aricia agestis]
MDATPSTSGNCKEFVIGKEVVITAQGSLRVTDNVLLERSASGRLRSYRPETISVADDIMLIDEMPRPEPSLRQRNRFPAERHYKPDEDDIFDPPLAAPPAVDSGSEAEEDENITAIEQLQEILETEEDEVLDNTWEADNNVFDWTDDYTSFRGVQEEFHEITGSKIEGTRPLEVFTQLWDEPLMELIKAETNRYAEDLIATHFETEEDLPQNSRLHQWSETTVAELYKLIGVMMIMGMCIRGRMDEYWSTGVLGMPGFRKLMSKGRFLLLMRVLHFVDNNTISGRGPERKLAKIKPILDYLNIKFKAAYTPRREVSIDESLLLWKGHLSWTQYIRTKAARVGIKSYELCEAATGYVLNIIIYTGKGTSAATAVYGFTSSTAKIVLELFKDYLGKGYKLFMDNFYNSIKLTRFLKSQRTDVVGTLNRRCVDCPQVIKDLKEKQVQRGAVESRHCGDVSVVAWKDVRLVTTVSTCHNANMVRRRRSGQVVHKPEVVHEYNQFMGGVDLKDQKLSMYSLERKRGLKWYVKVFRRLINISVLNSYILYCSNIGKNKKMTHRQFRYKLAEELCAQLEENLVSRAAPRHAEPCDRLNTSVDHFPQHKEASRTCNKQVRFQRGSCARCLAKKERKVCNILCSHCKVFLCIGQCWRDFHTLETL